MVTTLLADAYKYSHFLMAPPKTEKTYSNWTGRKFRLSTDKLVVLGLQRFIKKWLIEDFNENFFKLPWPYVNGRMKEVLEPSLGITDLSHFQALHKLGYLPLKIYALPEGVSIGPNIPSMVMVNTDNNFHWLPTFLETLMSAELWGPSTSATIAKEYRKIGEKWTKEYYGPNADLSFIDWQFHDFSMRGMYGVEASLLSGLGHLTQFTGSDTLACISDIRKYYPTDSFIAGSVPASEHSVMCAGGKETEYDTFSRFINFLFPSGIVSIVSDTWDLWKVLTEVVPKLKKDILKRNGKVVIRPDSSIKTPYEVVCGDPDSKHEPEKKGVIRLLAEVLGTKDGMINNAGCIYGDGISLELADKILGNIVTEIKLSPHNQVFGVGSYSYQYNTRDTLGFAQKSTEVVIDGKHVPIFKDPVTDKGLKKSHKGIVIVHKDQHGNYYYEDQQPEYMLDCCAFNKVFENGNLLMGYSFDDVRKRARC